MDETTTTETPANVTPALLAMAATILHEAIPPPLNVVRGATNREDRVKIRACELYLQDWALGDAAREVGCSRQYLYRMAKLHNWPQRRDRLRQAALLSGGQVTAALEGAVAELRARLSQRLFE